MSMANVMTGQTGPEEYWEPALTPREADKVGIPKDEYDSAVQYARMAVEEHQLHRTPRDCWEPTSLHNGNLADPYIKDGERELASRLEAEVDPVVDESQHLIENVKANLDELAEDREPISDRESGINYSVRTAVERVEQHDLKITRDEAVGKHHHHRTNALLQRLVIWVPWVETAGFLTFITYYLNVPLLEPWQDWLGWSFAATVVVGIILGQTWLVRHAARSHNHAREAHADRNRFEAEQGFTRRNRYLWVTAVTAVAITSGMIWRGLAALGSPGPGTTTVMVFVATVTGLLLPTLAYLGIALDGSRVSRERDSLVVQLDDDLDGYLETIGDSRRDLARAADIDVTLRNKTFPDICNTTQETVDGAYELYGTVRLLIGGLSADPPAKTTKTIEQDMAGKIRGYIGLSIQGASRVNLGPLFDRQNRLDKIEIQRSGLFARIDARPPHPWGKSRIT